jgi:glucose-6-phosphate 1-dehydrogenase
MLAGDSIKFGIIRDVMQNHLIQVLALVAMEPPKSLGASDIQYRRLSPLRKIILVALQLADCRVCLRACVRVRVCAIRDAKTKVLRSIPPIKPDDMLIGQYTAPDSKEKEGKEGEQKKGYTDDPSVPNKHSRTATFAVTELRVNNDRCASALCV